MAFALNDPQSGIMPIGNIDTGYLSPYQVTTGGTTYAPTPPMVLGMVVKATDPTYGQGEFILLPGVASNIVGAVVTYAPSTFATTLIANTANMATPVAVSTAANTSTTNWSWYQISGVATVKKTAVKVDPAINSYRMYISATAGRVMQTSAAGKCLMGLSRANTATVTSTTSTILCQLDRPHAQGPIT
jgi:hypothetical protein